MEKEKEEFKPFVPAEREMKEFSITAVIVGVLLAVVFGAANAYLGLRVGMTVSASIPAAVVSMGILRGLLRRNSILESNLVQTIGSAGESLAAGAIFTLPALFLWAEEGKAETPDLFTITALALCGGVLGVLFMVPLRKALIVKEHGVLPYPEGTACADVLLAGEEGGSGAKTVFFGMGFAALVKYVVDGMKVIPGAVMVPVNSLKTLFSVQVYPALMGVGYICGIRIASYMFAGAVLGWFVLIPAIVSFGGESVLYPGTVPITTLYNEGGASAIWSSYIRYIGAGAVAAGGIISLVKTLPLLFSTFYEAVKAARSGKEKSEKRTERDLDIRFVIGGIILFALLIWLVPALPISFSGAWLVILFGFFFATVSSRMVGLVGSSNNPVSGMTIATLLLVTAWLKATNTIGMPGMIAAISIASVICIVAALAGDTSQDLKTGFLLGATPRRQQIGELIGVAVSAVTIGGVMMLLNQAWQFGSEALAAPQATLMKMITEGVMEGNLPWTLIFIGVFIGVAVEIMGVPVLPVAIGLYLPFELSASILVGGILRYVSSRKKKDAEGGILFCSGLIAGEGLMGIVLAFLAVFGKSDKIDLSHWMDTGIFGAAALVFVIAACILISAREKKKPAD